MFGFLPSPCGCFSGVDRSVYRQHFCGLGTALHQHYGGWSRWLVNRDATFLSLLASAWQKHPPLAFVRTCCNPLGAARLMVDSSEGAAYAAAVTVCGLVTKLDDNATDESGWRRLVAQRGLRWTKDAQDRANDWLQRWDFPTHDVQRWMKAQSQLEKSGVSLKEAAEPTAQAFGRIVGHLPWVVEGAGSAVEASTQLEKAGQSLGRLIYTLDAVEDEKKDRARGRFNPLPKDRDEKAAAVTQTVETAFCEISVADEKIELARHHELVRGLWLDGAKTKTERRLELALHFLKKRTPEQKAARLERRHERKERYQQKKSECCHGSCDRYCGRCDCLDACHMCDCCFDCGRGDSGCCDCNPCDCN